MMVKKPQLRSLTGIRFFLALWVVVFHQTSAEGYVGPWMEQLPEPVFAWLRTGYVAVGFFFLLSGFVLAYSYDLGSWSGAKTKQFLVARFARIYPAYAVGLLLVAYGSLTEGTWVYRFKVALFNWTLLQAWYPHTALTWNAPGWSLSNEAFFYVCFPVVGVAVWKLERWRGLGWAAVGLWGLALAAPVAAVVLPVRGFGDAAATSLLPDADVFWSNLVKFNPLLHLANFCLGILTGRVYGKLAGTAGAGPWVGSWVGPWVGQGYKLYWPALVGELVVLGGSRWLPYPLVHNGLLLPLHALLILGLALGGGWLDTLLGRPLLVFLGNASYAMYLLHAPVSEYLNTAARWYSIRLQGAAGMAVYLGLVMAVAAAVLCGWRNQPTGF
jgi:peptidoglycan/LPS O-acetylase OafA/YrhL